MNDKPFVLAIILFSFQYKLKDRYSASALVFYMSVPQVHGLVVDNIMTILVCFTSCPCSDTLVSSNFFLVIFVS